MITVYDLNYMVPKIRLEMVNHIYLIFLMQLQQLLIFPPKIWVSVKDCLGPGGGGTTDLFIIFISPMQRLRPLGYCATQASKYYFKMLLMRLSSNLISAWKCLASWTGPRGFLPGGTEDRTCSSARLGRGGSRKKFAQFCHIESWANGAKSSILAAYR